MTLHHDATPQNQGGVVVGAATLNNGPGEPGVDSPSRGGKETTPPLKYKLVLELTREEVDDLYAQALAATREQAQPIRGESGEDALPGTDSPDRLSLPDT